MTTAARIREVRQELAELRDPGAHDGPGHDLFLILRKSYIEELELLGAPLQPEEVRRPVPRLVLRKALPETKMPPSATKPPIPATKPPVCATGPANPENPMTKRGRTAPTVSPEESLDTLLAKLSNATGDCATALDKRVFVKARAKVHQLRWEIGKLVKDHDLESPMLPAIPPNPWAKPQFRNKRAASKQSAPPQQLAASPEPEGAVQPDPVPLHVSPPARAFSPQEPLPEAAARFRALRVEALEILPLCEGLSREDGYAVRHQIDLLADVLAMGDRLAREAS